MRILSKLGTALSKNMKVAGYGREDNILCQLKSKLPTGDILSVVQNGSGDIDIMVYQPDPWDAPYQNLSLDSSKITDADIPAIVDLIDHYVADYQKYRNYKVPYLVYRENPHLNPEQYRVFRRYDWYFAQQIEYDTIEL